MIETKSKLRIGIVVNKENRQEEGGSYSYYHMLLKGINEYDFDERIEIVNILFSKEKNVEFDLKKPSIYIKYREAKGIKEAVKRTSLNYLNIRLSRKNPIVNYVSSYLSEVSNRAIENKLRMNKIDLVYYLTQELHVFNYPFIATNWDVAHRSINGFPEVTLENVYQARESFYLYTLNSASLILCESEAGAEELKRYYGYNSNKIKVLPIFAGDIVNKFVSKEFEQETLKKYNIQKDEYFLYPAQFWAFKNHYNLIIAFYSLITESNNTTLKLVLCGSDKGNMEYIKELIKQLNLETRVIITGFVTDEELFVFYSCALALTMATFLGPTNMPLIEAAHLKCAVLCSNLDGHRELLSDNALYFDPADAASIEKAMNQILDKNFRNNLIEAANRYIKHSPFNLSNTLSILNSTLINLIPYRRTWGQEF